MPRVCSYDPFAITDHSLCVCLLKKTKETSVDPVTGKTNTSTGIYCSTSNGAMRYDSGSSTTDEEQKPGANAKEKSWQTQINTDITMTIVMFTFCMSQPLSTGVRDTSTTCMLLVNCHFTVIITVMPDKMITSEVTNPETSCNGQAPPASDRALLSYESVVPAYCSAFDRCAVTVYGQTNFEETEKTSTGPTNHDHDASSLIITTENGADTFNVNITTTNDVYYPGSVDSYQT